LAESVLHLFRVKRFSQRRFNLPRRAMSIPKECKRLIEVDFPIAAVSAHSAREKSIRHGHPSTLHLWWARRPLAACRSVLLGLLLPDPCDKHCPADFKKKARELLEKRYNESTKTDELLREILLKFIGEFANWDHAANAMYLEVGRRRCGWAVKRLPATSIPSRASS